MIATISVSDIASGDHAPAAPSKPRSDAGLPLELEQPLSSASAWAPCLPLAQELAAYPTTWVRYHDEGKRPGVGHLGDAARSCLGSEVRRVQ